MTLVLSVASYRNRPPAPALIRQFEGSSISIGRGADNDWSLSDPEVHLSKKHCVISYLDGQYTITDISTNGVFVNGSPHPLGNGGTAVLRSGDRLLLGDYEVSVEIREGVRAGSARAAPPGVPVSPNDPFGLGDIMNPSEAPPSSFTQGPGTIAAPGQNPPSGVLGSDWLRDYDPVPRQSQDPNATPQFGAHGDHVPSVNAAYRPPNISFEPTPIGSFDIPDNWQNVPDMPRPHSTAAPQVPADWQNGNAPDLSESAPIPGREIPSDWRQTPSPSGSPAMPPPPQMPSQRMRNDAFPSADPRETSLPRRQMPLQPPDSISPPKDAYRPPEGPPRDFYGQPRDLPMPPRETSPPPPEIPLPPQDRRAQRDVPVARETPMPPRAQAPLHPPATAAVERRADAGWRAFLEAAGLEESAFSEDPVDLMRSLGRVFGEMVAGIRDLLATRDKVKTEYRVQRTVIRASNNNPLKFAIDSVEAAVLLLCRPKPGHLVGAKAVNEAFNDLKAHELAFMVGMQAAVTALLQEFDPAALKQRIDAQMRWDGLIPGARQSRYWAGYEEHYRHISSEIVEDARSTFGLAFAKAYEEQAKKL